MIIWGECMYLSALATTLAGKKDNTYYVFVASNILHTITHNTNFQLILCTVKWRVKACSAVVRIKVQICVSS